MGLEAVAGKIDLVLRNVVHEDILGVLKGQERLERCLDEGEAVLERLRQMRADKLHAKALSKLATMRKKEGMRLTEETFRIFCGDLRVLLRDRPEWLEALELNHPVRSKAESEKLERWRRMMLNLQALGTEVLERLAKQGYEASTLRERVGLLNMVGKLRAAQHETTGLRKAMVAREKKELESAKVWLNQLKARVEEGLRDAAEEQACFVREALGLKPGKSPAPVTELPVIEEDDAWMFELEPEVGGEVDVEVEVEEDDHQMERMPDFEQGEMGVEGLFQPVLETVEPERELEASTIFEPPS